MQTQEDMVKHQWAPITLAAIFAYMIVDCFIGVYGVNSYFTAIYNDDLGFQNEQSIQGVN